MKANELRIGNILMFTDFHARKERVICGADIAYAEKEPDWLDAFWTPIPLAEERLLRFGFKLEKSGWFVLKTGSKKTNDLKMFHFGNMYCDKKYNTKGGFSSGHMMIEYIHQLQNLYFALTGKELELKP